MKSYDITAKSIYPGNQKRQKKSKKKAFYRASNATVEEGAIARRLLHEKPRKVEKKKETKCRFSRHRRDICRKVAINSSVSPKPVKAKMALGKQLVFLAICLVNQNK